MEIAESIYESILEPYYKKLLEKKTTVLVKAGKQEENPPRHRLTPRWVRLMSNAEKDM